MAIFWKLTEDATGEFVFVEAADEIGVYVRLLASRDFTYQGRTTVTRVNSWRDVMPTGLDLGEDIGIPLVAANGEKGVFVGNDTVVLVDDDMPPESCFVHATLGGYDWRVDLDQRIGVLWAVARLHGDVGLVMNLRRRGVSPGLAIALISFGQQGGFVLQRN